VLVAFGTTCYISGYVTDLFLKSANYS